MGRMRSRFLIWLGLFFLTLMLLTQSWVYSYRIILPLGILVGGASLGYGWRLRSRLSGAWSRAALYLALVCLLWMIMDAFIRLSHTHS